MGTKVNGQINDLFTFVMFAVAPFNLLKGVVVLSLIHICYFTPNRQTHPAFADALKEAEENGVKILAYDCYVTEDSIEIAEEIPVILECPQLYEMRDCLLYTSRCV